MSCGKMISLGRSVEFMGAKGVYSRAWHPAISGCVCYWVYEMGPKVQEMIVPPVGRFSMFRDPPMVVARSFMMARPIPWLSLE